MRVLAAEAGSVGQGVGLRSSVNGSASGALFCCCLMVSSMRQSDMGGWDVIAKAEGRRELKYLFHYSTWTHLDCEHWRQLASFAAGALGCTLPRVPQLES